MTDRLRVLILSGCYLPGFRAGGPIRSLVNLVTALGPDVDFRIVTLDTDVGSDVPYTSIRSGVWQTVSGVEVLYLPKSAVSIRRLRQEISTIGPHLIYLNGLFEPDFTIRYLWARRWALVPDTPVVLAPRGDCSPGALRLKRLKKRLFVHLARVLGLYRTLTWQASSEMEANDIRRLMHTSLRDVHVAPVLTDGMSLHTPLPRRPGVLRLCFLSRISPMKNLDFALRVLAGVIVPVEFHLYGPKEDEAHWAECAQLIAALPGHVTAEYLGEVQPSDVRATIAAYDLLFLPTRGENFGHVIYEALSAGVPVLTSNRTPWRDLETRGAGWVHSLDDEAAFRRAIETASSVLPQERDAFARRAIAYADEASDRSAAIRRTHELFRTAAGA